MLNFKIIPINENHIEKFCAAVTSVVKERKYLAFLEGPTLEMTRTYIRENMADNRPHFIALINDDVVGWCDITSLHRYCDFWQQIEA
ncbi:MAG: hypothetical protein ACD_46C00269G0005 [uncultured bacterium]|nr:MAG: hypothetical protein ACD_46C00269G0005 [uncultured bacterium]